MEVIEPIISRFLRHDYVDEESKTDNHYRQDNTYYFIQFTIEAVVYTFTVEIPTATNTTTDHVDLYTYNKYTNAYDILPLIYLAN